MSLVKKGILCSFSLTLLAALGPAIYGSGDEVFKGEIADSQCAMNVHSLDQSHKEMLKVKSVGTTDADCTWYCVKQLGGRFVLQVKSKVYKLDIQALGREFAARKVKITGTLDTKTNTIHVHHIELLPEAGQAPAPAPAPPSAPPPAN
ncbi:MAG TPA: hypothetical protein VEU31_05060 [Candidatus Acidoferrales bacterium]|nr:hypothetical protein [Candidatus Acidoferrales bacterium]